MNILKVRYMNKRIMRKNLSCGGNIGIALILIALYY